MDRMPSQVHAPGCWRPCLNSSEAIRFDCTIEVHLQEGLVMRRLATGRSCGSLPARSLALRPRLSAGLLCFRPDPATVQCCRRIERYDLRCGTPIAPKYWPVRRRIARSSSAPISEARWPRRGRAAGRRRAARRGARARPRPEAVQGSSPAPGRSPISEDVPAGRLPRRLRR